ncbi:extracellular solute-binding protein [Oceanivirga miroungae]|uniref:Spermidine-binding periplasmic protein SpuE n=1 Tax=Oceanivirga miroungae TaxID=1130046 RepID=A0A6I8M6U8_9FUSO|nr:extracellular solute-binding protein [Oceanivirga miroungae]VWL85115.1 Spermidine-binding periplasmic protein SpuE [Oceanivirga miroungae]
MKKIFKLFLMCILSIFAVSCSGEKEAENELNIYTWIYFVPDEVIENFEKETGIKVNISYYDTNDTLMAKLLSGTTQYDIVSPSTDFVPIMVEAGMLEKFDKSKLTETFKNLDTEGLNLYEYAKVYDDGLNYSLPYGFFATGITVNKEKVGNIPYNLDIFLNSDFKGAMTMLDDGREVIGMMLQHFGYSSDSSNDNELNKVKEELIKYKKNLAKFDSTTFGKGLAAGEFIVSHGYPDVFYETEAYEQDKFVYILPKGAMMYIDNMSITKNSKHKDNAYKFLEYLYKPENYKYVFENFRQIPVVKGVYELTDTKPIASAKDIMENAKLPRALSDEAKEKQEKIFNEVKLAK